MLRLDRAIKTWKESAALNDHINLYGFWSETVFLTKSGDLGMVLSRPGVDYERLDRSEQEFAVKRLEAALKAFGPGFHVYQYLFKANRPDIPFATYDDPIVAVAACVPIMRIGWIDAPGQAVLRFVIAIVGNGELNSVKGLLKGLHHFEDDVFMIMLLDPGEIEVG
jgi:hypothetical protein